MQSFEATLIQSVVTDVLNELGYESRPQRFGGDHHFVVNDETISRLKEYKESESFVQVSSKGTISRVDGIPETDGSAETTHHQHLVMAALSKLEFEAAHPGTPGGPAFFSVTKKTLVCHEYWKVTQSEPDKVPYWVVVHDDGSVDVVKD